MAKFVQIIEYRTSSPDEVMRLSEGWADATRGRTTAVSSLTCIDRQDGHYYTLVEFPSFEAAMENSSMAETKVFAGKLADLCDEPPNFHDLDVVFREAIGAAEMTPSEPRLIADCRDMPSDTGCTLTITGRESEVIEAAAQHAASIHGHEDGPELRRMIRDSLREEAWL